MLREQVRAPLPADNAAQAVVATTEIDKLDREIDPNARRQREQRLPHPANHGGDLRGVATLVEMKPKSGANLELDLFRCAAGQPQRQQCHRLALHRSRSGRLAQVILQRRVADAMLGRYSNPCNRALLRLSNDCRPKFCSMSQ